MSNIHNAQTELSGLKDKYGDVIRDKHALEKDVKKLDNALSAQAGNAEQLGGIVDQMIEEVSEAHDDYARLDAETPAVVSEHTPIKRHQHRLYKLLIALQKFRDRYFPSAKR